MEKEISKEIINRIIRETFPNNDIIGRPDIGGVIKGDNVRLPTMEIPPPPPPPTEKESY